MTSNLYHRLVDYPTILEESLQLEKWLSYLDYLRLKNKPLELSNRDVISTNPTCLQSLRTLNCTDLRILDTQRLVWRALTYDFVTRSERELYSLETINQNKGRLRYKLDWLGSELLSYVVQKAIRDKIDILTWCCTESAYKFYCTFLEREWYTYDYDKTWFEIDLKSERDWK